MTVPLVSADDYELAEAALAASENVVAAAMRMLRDECGWTLRQAHDVIRFVQIQRGDRVEVAK